ncbi:putative gamma-glutamyltransferase YwrD [Diplogelasinospora grovesii]|uniref:Gamma-glutamyltransferase YwrD n=1 Tax=Diplogelasinospora grovesii TaxID=303347 RepID=A0AAN6NE49_9PEZI|nr:putative gamma-glutamyltransferase YwrD [Diplogelasinospora grovesii]
MPLPTSSVYPPAAAASSASLTKWPSRRSVVHSTRGMVACTQPLAAKCGIDVLNAGGNAADAAVAVAAGLNVTEPCNTGIGGDMFCLFYSAATGKVSALNGSGRAGSRYTLETIQKALPGVKKKIPMSSVHSVTVPGAAAGWVDTVERFGSGRLTMEEILKPAVKLAEDGFPVSEITAYLWNLSEDAIRKASPNGAEMLKTDPAAPEGVRAPRAGEIVKLPNLAQTFRTLAKEGKAGFYSGRVAEELIKVVQDLGGHLELDDLKHHMDVGSEAPEPVSLKFTGQGQGGSGVQLWEHPPNGQGIVALMALGIIQELEKEGKVPKFGADDHNTAPYLHAIIEALRIAFADASWFITDPNVERVPTKELVAQEYLKERAKLFSPDRASDMIEHGNPSPALNSSDTVYFCCADAEGNAISFINSNYGGFGTCIIPRGCGFTLQNRGANFSLDPKHPNVIAPRKRPYHTIIPGLVTNLDGSLHSVFGVMGGFMQPQGQIQVLLGQLVGGLNPQQALDAPRVCIGGGMPSEDGELYDRTVSVEEGMPEETVEGLKALGHKVKVVTGMERGLFGRGQIIRYTVDPVEKGTGVWSGGSDMRGDGAAYPA